MKHAPQKSENWYCVVSDTGWLICNTSARSEVGSKRAITQTTGILWQDYAYMEYRVIPICVTQIRRKR